MSLRQKLTPKRIFFFTLVLLLFTAGIPGSVYAFNQHKYNILIGQAEQSIQNDQFDKAVELYNLASTYRKKGSPEIAENLAMLDTLKESNTAYENALRIYDSKQYLEAIATFSKVAESDSKRYSLAQEKISECKQKFIEATLQNAKVQADTKNFDAALKALEPIFTLDSKNTDALKQKQEFTLALENLKREQANAKANDAKALEEAQKNSGLNLKPASNPVVVSTGNDKLTIKDNGYVYVVSLQQRSLPGYLNYIIASYPSPNLDSAPMISLDYTGVLHLGTVNLDIKGKTNDNYRELFVYDLKGKTCTADLTVTYKNKKYSFTTTFTIRS